MATKTEEPHGPSSQRRVGRRAGSVWALMLGALGVVYGDIGTSPLYALKECFSPDTPHHVTPTPANVLGVLSLVFWSLTLIVSVKYLAFVLRADNDGQGGILALLALLPPRSGQRDVRLVLLPLALFGAALLYGDGVITPAISVLSAVEGMGEAARSLEPTIVPLTCGILTGVFLMQKHSAGRIGAVLGPIVVLWFTLIGALGLRGIASHPSVLQALSPLHAVEFFRHNGAHGLVILGSVVLCIAGSEVLYADMGHFGRGPIRRSWFALVFPALLLNYFGQGANLLVSQDAARSPFYALVPSWATYPVVVLATAATVIASRALISGAFSLTQQAVQLGYFPRVTIVHTTERAEGPIYIPEVNWILLVACVTLVLAFRTSTRLAAAYGIAATGTMAITTIVYFVVVTERWRWPLWKAVPFLVVYLIIDLAFLGGNLAKLFPFDRLFAPGHAAGPVEPAAGAQEIPPGYGGWAPIIMGAAVYTVMTTWKAGRAALGAYIQGVALPLQSFLDDLAAMQLYRVRGTAVFLSSNPDGTPSVLLHHVKHNKALHEQVVLLSILSERVPEVPHTRRVEVVDLGQGIFLVKARYGFMQTPTVPSVLEACRQYGIRYEPGRTSYYLGRETLLTTGKSGMSRWRKALFAFLSRNARSATAYFGLPPNRVVELGMQIDL